MLARSRILSLVSRVTCELGVSLRQVDFCGMGIVNCFVELPFAVTICLYAVEPGRLMVRMPVF